MYIPIMKNRSVEVSVLRQLSEKNIFGENIIPLIEVIQERTRSNMKNTFFEELTQMMISSSKMRVMIDFYKTAKLRSTSESIREYITRVNRQPDFYLSELDKMTKFKNRVIPVISYIQDNVTIDRLRKDIDYLHKNYYSIAYRIKTQDFDFIFDSISDLFTINDYVILDIESSSYTSPVFKRIYKKITDLRRKIKYKSIVIQDHKPHTLYNNKMADKEPIPEIDTGLKDLYSTSYMNKFNGFGDYASINSSLPTTGGSISPVGIFYSNENNFFVSFKGRKPLLSEFPDYIAPSIIKSEFWEEFDNNHHNNCLGCQEIENIIKGLKSGKNQAQWKMIAMLHYIYTMFEVNA